MFNFLNYRKQVVLQITKPLQYYMKFRAASPKLILVVGLILFYGCAVQENTGTTDKEQLNFFKEADSSTRVGATSGDGLGSSYAFSKSSSLLKIDFDISDIPEIKEETKYFASEKYDWVITATARSGKSFSRSQIDKYFDQEWSQNSGFPMLYVMGVNSTSWVYYPGFGAGDKFTKVAIGYKLFDAVTTPKKGYALETLSAYKTQVEQQLNKLRPEKVVYNYTVEQATDISHKLAWLVAKNDKMAVIVLKADHEYDGKRILDVMQSVGLEYGSGRKFHWRNTDFPFADEYYMDVWTNSAPGYFDLVRMEAGVSKTRDIVFGFSIPRSIAPVDIYNAMYNIAEYVQQHLGGVLTDVNGVKLHKETALKQIEGVVRNLEDEGIKHGVGDALYLFQKK